jgi:hypothetical protein
MCGNWEVEQPISIEVSYNNSTPRFGDRCQLLQDGFGLVQILEDEPTPNQVELVGWQPHIAQIPVNKREILDSCCQRAAMSKPFLGMIEHNDAPSRANQIRDGSGNGSGATPGVQHRHALTEPDEVHLLEGLRFERFGF